MNQDRDWYNTKLEYNGQAYADKFVLNCTNFKTNGYFLELGSRHPKENNNSYILEKEFGWKGVMVDREPTYEQDYKTERPNSVAIIEDATEVNYTKVFEENNFPFNAFLSSKGVLIFFGNFNNELNLLIVSLMLSYIGPSASTACTMYNFLLINFNLLN